MSRVTFVFLLLLAAPVPAGAASAEPAAFHFKSALRLLGGTVTVPPEWDGIWTTQDSTYDCATGPTGTSSSSDTLCTGQVFNQSPPGPVAISCTGTADATTFHTTCDGSTVIFPDCKASYAIQVDGTRTGDSYRSVTVVNVTYSGTAKGCDLVPPSCTRIVSYGTRTGPAPASYCVTPVKASTWGKLKLIYR